MDILFLIKYGEISLKGENKKIFLNQLRKNIKARLRGMQTTLTIKPGRFYLTAPAEHEAEVRDVLSNTFGIIGFSKALQVKKTIESIEEAALILAEDLLKKGRGNLFKIDVRRTDKSFPMDSYGIACRLGDILCEKFPQLTVNLKNADWRINVEVRDTTYLYADTEIGRGGLPVHCAGKGLLLLSGGIDSPVAGYLMAKRGLFIEAIYFHTPPFTSGDVKEKLKTLTMSLSQYIPYINLLVVPFTKAQLLIKEKAKKDEVTLLSRAAMMSISHAVAEKRKAACLITGESLSQVASQTVESIRFTGSYTTFPVFRPLIGMDKNEIIRIAEQIGTYKTSILPYPDCCTLFAPRYPLIKPDFGKMKKSFDALQLPPLLEEAIENIEDIQLWKEES
ncbi:MAG: tRNA 4-thiouridine(8) synthase ThiI [Spirochaetales bacterium]|nr:tRNA 4-thiouridine(8) synthase ThiI [Spirochaetales bacterium]